MQRRGFLLGAAAIACAKPRSRGVDLDPERAPSPPEHDARRIPAIAPTIPFGMYSAPPARMRELADAGFTWAGPFYPRELELAPDRIEAATQARLGALVPVGWHRKPGEAIPWDAATTAREIAAAVEARADDDAVAGWYLVPEELSPADERDLAYLELATRTIREADPKARPIFGYQPNARAGDQLRPISRHLDRIAKGTYVNWTGHREQRVWVRWSVEQVAAATDGDRLPLAALEMFEDPRDASAADIERWVRHDVLLALLSGARGILVFSGWRRPKFERYDDYFAAYARVVAELRRAGVADAVKDGQAPTVQVKAGPTEADAGMARFPSVTARSGGAVTVVVNSAPAPVVVRLPDTVGEIECGHATWYPRSALLDLPPAGAAIIRA
jgi:hypothetical protein